MVPFTLKQLACTVNGHFQKSSNECDVPISGVSIDSRTIEKGQLFMAIAGEAFDGHTFAAAAAQKGAACIVAERPVDVPADVKTPVVLVDDTVAALGQLAAWYRDQLKAKVIAITGSAGKTTTRQMLHHVLSRSYKCRQAQKSFNNHIGVPLTILSAEVDDEVLVLELGSNHPGEIVYLTDIARPDAAVITFVGPAHLEGFLTLDNILREKASIAEGLRPGGTVYANGDQPELVRHLKSSYDKRLVAFGTNAGCDVLGTDLCADGQTGSLVIDGTRVNVPLPGRANLQNALCAWSICRDLKISLSDFSSALASMTPVSMRLEVVNIGPLTVINDCYNANPASMANALGCLQSIAREKSARAVFIAGSMGELGQLSDQLHIELGQNAAGHGVTVLLASGPFAEQILQGARRVSPSLTLHAYENTGQLCDNLHKWLRPDDIVLVKGSRSAGLEKAILRLNELFKT